MTCGSLSPYAISTDPRIMRAVECIEGQVTGYPEGAPRVKTEIKATSQHVYIKITATFKFSQL